MSCPSNHHCPLCDPEMARVASMAIHDVPGYAKWLTQRTENAMRHLSRHAVAGEARRTPVLLRTHVRNAPDTATDNPNGVPAPPSLLSHVRRSPIHTKAATTTKGHKKS